MMDYEGIAVARLTGQFENSPLLQGVVAAMTAPLTVLETEADSLRYDRWIDSAIGVQLDGCGDIIGERRDGRDDDEYRKALKFRVFVNVSKGTPTDIIYGLNYLTEPDDSQYLEIYPATVMLFSDGFEVDETIKDTMQDLLPAGVSDVPVAVSYGADPFRFASASVPSELWTNGDNFEVGGSDLQVTTTAVSVGEYTFGGVVGSDLEVTGDEVYLEVSGGFGLALYAKSSTTTLGTKHLTGVYQ